MCEVRVAVGSLGRRRRKVRVPQSRVPGNARASVSAEDGKCHRKQTADGPFGGTGKGERVR